MASILIMLLLVTLVTNCGGGRIVTVKTISSGDSSQGNYDDSIQKLKADRPTEVLGVSLELKGIPKMGVHHYLRDNPDEKKKSDYILGHRDVIQVDFLEAHDLSGKMEINSEGFITLGHVGKLHVGNLTPDEAAASIKSVMTEKHILNNPEIYVTVAEAKSRKIKIIGSVGKAGQYFLKPGSRVLDVITEAGGWNEFNIGKETGKGLDIASEIFVIRRTEPGSKFAIEIKLNDLVQGEDPKSNILLKDEDIIYIPPAKRYMIIGEVKTPGVFTIDSLRRTSILEAIIQAGGFTPIAAKNKVWIYRTKGDTLSEIRVRVGDIMKGGHKEIVYLEDNDLIVVPETLF